VRRLLLAGFCVAILVFATQSLKLASLAGIDFTHRNSPTSQKYLIETMGGGVALLDYNNDGLLDVFLVNGGKLEDPVKLPVNFSRRDPAYWNRLYRQNRCSPIIRSPGVKGAQGRFRNATPGSERLHRLPHAEGPSARYRTRGAQFYDQLGHEDSAMALSERVIRLDPA
jgi:hypothetical protein